MNRPYWVDGDLAPLGGLLTYWVLKAGRILVLGLTWAG